MNKRFYVGSRLIAEGESDHVRSTYAEALHEATVQCRESGESQIVVEIVARVMPKPLVDVQEFKYPTKKTPRRTRAAIRGRRRRSGLTKS